MPRTLLLLVAVGLAGCVMRSPLDLGSVSSRLQPPRTVKQTLVRFDSEGPRAFPPPDHAIPGRWINRVGYVASQQSTWRTYLRDGTWTGPDAVGDFVTLQADGFRWLYEVARRPDGSVAGRSLRLYAVDGDQMLARFPDRHSGWEFWERSTDK